PRSPAVDARRRRYVTNARPVSAATLRESVQAGASPVDSIVRALDRAREVDAGREGLNILLHEHRQSAIADAERVGARCEMALTDGGSVGTLAGVPVVVKDNIATRTLPTSCGSRILEGYVSPYEASVVTRLRRAGAVVVAKSNMDEFAMGS